MYLNRRILIGALALAFSGCAANRAPDGPQVGRNAPGREVVVENWTGTNLQVYAIYGGDITRIGRVRALGSTLVRVPDAAGGEIQLLTRPTGIWETSHISEPVHVGFDRRVTWQLRATGGSAITYMPQTMINADEVAGRPANVNVTPADFGR